MVTPGVHYLLCVEKNAITTITTSTDTAQVWLAEKDLTTGQRSARGRRRERYVHAFSIPRCHIAIHFAGAG